MRIKIRAIIRTMLGKRMRIRITKIRIIIKEYINQKYRDKRKEKDKDENEGKTKNYKYKANTMVSRSFRTVRIKKGIFLGEGIETKVL